MKAVILTASTMKKELDGKFYSGKCITALDLASKRVVRLVQNNQGAPIESPECDWFEPLDVFDIVVKEACPLNCQTENVLVQSANYIEKYGGEIEDIYRLFPKFGGDDPSYMLDGSYKLTDISHNKHSLELIEVSELTIRGKKCSFRYQDKLFRFVSVTDPKYALTNEAEKIIGDAFLVISIPADNYKGLGYYKFVASVFPIKKKWTIEEDEDLLYERRKGWQIQLMCAVHKRTEEEIRRRLAYLLVNETKKISCSAEKNLVNTTLSVPALSHKRDEKESITEKVLEFWNYDENDYPTTTQHLADNIMKSVSPEILTDYSVLQNPFLQADMVSIALIYCRTMFSRGLFLSIDKLKESEASSIEDRIFTEIEDICISTALQSLYGIDANKWKAAHERRRKERKLIDLVKEPKSIQPFIEHAVSTFIFPDYLNKCFLAYPLEHPYTLPAQDQVERQVLEIFNLFLERVHWILGELLGEATSRYDYEHRQPTPKQTNMAEGREYLAQLRKKAELGSAVERVRWDKAIAQKQISPDMRPTITLVNRELVIRFDWDSRSLSQSQLRDQMRRGSEYYFWDIRKQTVGKLLVTHTYWDCFTFSYLQKKYYCSFMKASNTLYESYDDVLTREQRIEKEKKQREKIILGEVEKITSSSE